MVTQRSRVCGPVSVRRLDGPAFVPVLVGLAVRGRLRPDPLRSNVNLCVRVNPAWVVPSDRDGPAVLDVGLRRHAGAIRMRILTGRQGSTGAVCGAGVDSRVGVLSSQ